MFSYKTTSKITISASQLISNMICMSYDNNKKFGLSQFHSGYGNFYLNSPKGYSWKIINAQTALWNKTTFFLQSADSWTFGSVSDLNAETMPVISYKPDNCFSSL